MALPMSMMRKCQDDAKYGGHDEKVQDMQARLETLQAELDSQHFSASAGNDYVTATVTGSGALHAIKIDPSVIDPMTQKCSKI